MGIIIDENDLGKDLIVLALIHLMNRIRVFTHFLCGHIVVHVRIYRIYAHYYHNIIYVSIIAPQTEPVTVEGRGMISPVNLSIESGAVLFVRNSISKLYAHIM